MPNNLVIYANPNDKKTSDLHNFLSKHAPYQIKLNPEVKTVKNATVYISGFNRSLLSLDESNKTVLISRRGSLSSQDFMILPMVDIIVTHTQHEAIQISWQLRCKGFKTKVVHLLPWCEREILTNADIYCPEINELYKKSLVGQIIQNVDPKAKIRMYLTQTTLIPDSLIKGMLSGAIIVALDMPPFNELIIHGHNGYLIRDPGDLVDVFNGLEQDESWISHNARMSTNATFKPTRYLDSILFPEKLFNINNFEKTPKDFKERTWLVRERAFQNGKLTYLPVKYNQDLTVIDLSSMEEILGYFLTQNFSDVYVFGCELPEELESRDEVQLQRTLLKLGKRGLKIHFCRDEHIPKIWKRIFKNLSTLSVEEGLKQVSK